MEEIYDDTIVQASKNSLRNVVRWIVYIAVFLVPLWFLPFTADVLEFNKQVLLLLLSGLGLVLFLPGFVFTQRFFQLG